MKQDKRCPKCGQNKSLDSFHKDRHRKDGKAVVCKACKAEYMKAYKPKKSHRHYALKKKYGISEEQYIEMLEAQREVCWICGSRDEHGSLAVDHNHSTGNVRGLLCIRCNTAIGSLRDDPELCRRAAIYLERHV